MIQIKLYFLNINAINELYYIEIKKYIFIVNQK